MSEIETKSSNPEKKTSPRGRITFNKERCKGCGYCVEFCPKKVLVQTGELSPKGYMLAAVRDESQCIACGLCEAVCPEFGIKVTVLPQ